MLDNVNEAEILQLILKLSPFSIMNLVQMGIAKHPAFRTHLDAVLLSIAIADEKFRNELFKMSKQDTIPQQID